MYVVHTELNVQCNVRLFVFYYRSCKRLTLVCVILLMRKVESLIKIFL